MITVRATGLGDSRNGLPGAGPYRYRKNPDWDPAKNALPPRKPGSRRGVPNRAAAQVAEDRRNRFAQYRAEGRSVAEAGELIGVSRETARKYERKRLKEAGEAS